MLVGRALMAKPQLLMLDEPSLGLAPRIVREIFHIIARLRETGVAILLVEQNARALQVADYGYVLETGEVTLHGPARELAGDPKVIELSRPGQGRRQVRGLIAFEAAAAAVAAGAQRSNISTTRKRRRAACRAVATVALEVRDVPVAPCLIRAFPSATAKASSTWSKRWITTLTVSITQAGRPWPSSTTSRRPAVGTGSLSSKSRMAPQVAVLAPDSTRASSSSASSGLSPNWKVTAFS